MEPEGALFCSGQYVDHGGNLDECLSAIEAAIEFESRGSSSASCQNNSCQAEAEGEASASCALAPGSRRRADLLWLLAAVGLAGLARRRRAV
jgi:hypothetical protein